MSARRHENLPAALPELDPQDPFSQAKMASEFAPEAGDG
jgi:hypothetical protein